MPPAIKPLSIPGAFLVEPEVFPDVRGYFLETWRAGPYAEAGMGDPLQDSVSCSKRSVIRGMYYQAIDPQCQMVTVAHGRVLDVIVDLRRGSPTFLRHETILLDSARPFQVVMPPGVAHGFCVLSELAVLQYKATRHYKAQTQRGVRWSDPDLGIDWPVQDPIMSPRDAALPLLKDVPVDELPVYT